MRNDSLYWHKLLLSKCPNRAKWKNLLFQGNFEIINDKPLCPTCNNHVWYPKIFGSIDVGYKIIYTCDCGATITTITCDKEATGNVK